MCLAAIAVMAGHAFPVFLKFKGGKAVACYVGAFLCLTPLALGAVLVVFVILVAFTRHISVGSIVGAATLPMAVWLVQQAPIQVVVTSILTGGFIIYKHNSNMQRLRAGTENVFSFGARKPGRTWPSRWASFYATVSAGTLAAGRCRKYVIPRQTCS
jgi:glycerol-3-phosphate acyltransferase PlsY